jgi:serine/threonine protein kinase
MKRCPYCAEEIQGDAVKCKHCGELLNRHNTDTLDKAVTLGVAGNGPQYDTLDVAATQGREATILAGQYRIVKKIGEGGMGVVYLAEDIELENRKVAIKALPDLHAGNIRAVENLRKEALTAIKLNHPNIIRLHGFHSDSNIKFLVMEYVDGQTLEERAIYNTKGRLTIEEIPPIAEQVASALDYAHKRNPPVFHRDLKPSNVMIDKNGKVKLLDFGVAREMKDSYTRITGKEASGTLLYMSPQQINGEKPNAAMDIYSFGVTIYECLAGRPPFFTGDIKYQILNKPAPLIEDVPEHVNLALQASLSKKESDRPVSAKAFIQMLKDPALASARADIDMSEVETAHIRPDAKEVVEKIRKWVENRRAEWSEDEWKDFVISLYDDGCAVGMSRSKLEHICKRERKAWLEADEIRKAEEAKIAQEAERKRHEAEEARRRKQEQELLEELSSFPTIALCKQYLKEFSKSRSADKIRDKLEQLQDEEKWRRKKRKQNLEKVFYALKWIVTISIVLLSIGIVYYLINIALGFMRKYKDEIINVASMVIFFVVVVILDGIFRKK